MHWGEIETLDSGREDGNTDSHAESRAGSHPMSPPGFVPYSNGLMNGEKKDGNSGASDLTLRDRVDQMERNLAVALKSYRQQAEEILEEHYEYMEQAQNSYDHQISLLRAENSQLRKLIGVKQPDSSIAQNILFQAMPAQDGGMIDKKAVAKAARRGGDDDKQVLTTRNKRKGQQDQNQQAGGAWQQFMAWVPNGAALQSAEPWKPLPPQQMGLLAPTSPGAANSKTKDGQLKSQKSVTYQGVLPGFVDTGDDDDLKKDDDEKSNDSSEETAMLGKDVLEVVDTWKPSHRESRKMNEKEGSIFSGSDDQSDHSSMVGDAFEDTGFENTKVKPAYILDPDANTRIVWDLSSLFLVVYDMIMIPMMSFDMPENAFFATMDWITRLFWTFDIGWSCCTGVVLDDGTVEYSTRFILRRYAKSWLPLDVFIVGSDWSGLIFQSGGMGLSRLARVSRVARIVRLLRLVRMQEIMANIMERIQNDKIQLLLQVLKLLAFLIVVCHVMACLWWAIGDRSTDYKTWVTQYGYADSDVGLGYIVSLHWSLCQFGGGMDELSPVDGLERFFAVVTFVFAFMAGLIMLSFLTSTMTQQYIIGGSGARQMATLKKYLNQNKIPKNLTKRVCRNAKHAISGDLTPDTVDLLHVVSEPLQIEMHHEIYMRVLTSHPFFHELHGQCPHLLRRVCHLAMATLWLASGDVMFSKGEEPNDPKMCFVMSGSLIYTDKDGEKTQLTERMWVAEGVLWTSWRHMGSLVATNDVKLGLLDALSFQDICAKFMKKGKRTSLRLKRYAKAFVEELNQAGSYSDLALNT